MRDLQLSTEFENESGYRFASCNLCINKKCKSTKNCDYYEKYSFWLEGKLRKVLKGRNKDGV